MKDWNIEDDELKDLLKSALTADPSAGFASKMMQQIQTAHQGEMKKAARQQLLIRKVPLVLATAFLLNVIVLLFTFIPSVNQWQYLYNLLSLNIGPAIHSMIIIASLTLAISVWILIYMERKVYQGSIS